jgi:hypothetical protein
MGANKVTVAILLNDESNSWDVTGNVIAVSTSVGKNRIFDRVQPGTAEIVLNNFKREFDPLNTSSAFYGSVIPKASKVYISMNLPGVPVSRHLFVGYIDDWSFDYSVDGMSTARFTASEASALFVRQAIFASSFPAELSGARIQRILSDDGVVYSDIKTSNPRVIDAGTQMLDADNTCYGKNVLEYLNSVAVSEQGTFFYDTSGSLHFQDNSHSPTSDINNAHSLFTDDATSGAYPYSNIEIGYSSEILYNQIAILSADGTKNVQSNDAVSQSIYDIGRLEINDVLYSDEKKLSNLGSFLITKYGNPEYRINSVTVSFISLSQTLQDNLLFYAQINDFMRVRFTPNGVGTPVEQYVRVIGIEHNVDIENHYVRYSFESLRNPSLVLDDTLFGKLDNYALGL